MPKTLAAATVDRLLHHDHVLLTDGTDLPPRSSECRQGGEASHVTDGHQRGDNVTAVREIRRT